MKKKLIEVALPLEAINRASAREKSIRHGHPSTLHLWWARRPLATCRAVLFASLVDDPSSLPEKFPTEEAQEIERQRLFRIIEELVKWENTNNDTVLNAARAEILKSTAGNPPSVLDPFCGGGSIPLEAQRLGLEAHASDLNPVAVLITKALIEIPPKFAGRPPGNPEAQKKLDHSKTWRGAQGLAEDVRYYGQWMRDEAGKRIGHLYPKINLPKEQGGGEASVIAWIWARTVRCPNPACRAQMPLVRSFWLSTKASKETWVEPVVDKRLKTVRFRVNNGGGPPPEGTVNRRGATCIVCGTPVPFEYVREESKAHRMGAQLMAIVAGGTNTRLYLSPIEAHQETAKCSEPVGVPDTELPKKALGFRVQNYGMTHHRQLFTNRQLTALTTLCELIREAHARITREAGCDEAYANALATYLAFSLSKAANYWSSICTWHQAKEILVSTFGLPVLPMTWDYAEVNPFSDSTGNWMLGIEQVSKALLATPQFGTSRAYQADAAQLHQPPRQWLGCTDPPYYDNVPYADLSDFFYIWLRRSLGSIYAELLGTILVPKSCELIAEPFRHGGKIAAQKFFESGLREVFRRVHLSLSAEYPFTVFYAFKQQETEVDDAKSNSVTGIASTGWETMLEGLLGTGFSIAGTWPMRTEQPGGLREVGRNSLASSIVLACRPRPESAPLATRREFVTALKNELPAALKNIQRGNIAPVDLAQASIGPGMAVFSRYSKVVEADGSAMRVRAALALINQTLDEVLAEQEGEFDADTRWALAWFEHSGMEEGLYGVAETLSKAKNTSVQGMVEAGVAKAKAGKVRLVRREELADNWDPSTDSRITIWEVTQHLIRALEKEGEAGAGAMLRKLGSLGEVARDLAYRLYTLCERKKWAEEALAYNSLVVAWPEITRFARSEKPREEQRQLL